MLLLLLLTDLLGIIYLINRFNLSGMKLFLAIVTVFWGLQTIMTQMETWYFRKAMPAITDSELRNLFIRPLITFITFIPIAMWIMDKWRQTDDQSKHQTQVALNWKVACVLSVIYVLIYFVFGYYVAWQFKEVRLFYTGSPDTLGFFEQIRHIFTSDPFLFLFQLFRGFLWIVIGMPIVLFLKGNNTERVITCVLFYSILPCVQLLVDNPFMPEAVRLDHLIEVSTSNGLFGLLIGLTIGKKITRQPLKNGLPSLT
jgi:uncharacterized membrane protein YGL010W